MHVFVNLKKCKECIETLLSDNALLAFSELPLCFTLTPVNGRVAVETILLGARAWGMTEDPVHDYV